MRAVSVQPIGKNDDGKEVINAFIVSDDTPESLPINGENIEGMNADQVFAPFSILYVIGEADTKVYAANESGVFIAQ